MLSPTPIPSYLGWLANLERNFAQKPIFISSLLTILFWHKEIIFSELDIISPFS